MTITALPAPPSNTDSPAVFATKAGAFVAALPQLVTQINAEVTETIPAIVGTVAGAAAKALVDIPAAVAMVGAAVAETAAGRAEAAKVAAEASAVQAQISSKVYDTTALGILGTTNGQYFGVPQAFGDAVDLWRNVANVATPTSATMAFKRGQDAITRSVALALALAPNPVTPIFSLSLLDGVQNNGVWHPNALAADKSVDANYLFNPNGTREATLYAGPSGAMSASLRTLTSASDAHYLTGSSNGYGGGFVTAKGPAGSFKIGIAVKSAPGAGNQTLWAGDYNDGGMAAYAITESAWTYITKQYTGKAEGWGPNFWIWNDTNTTYPVSFLIDEVQGYAGTVLPAFTGEVAKNNLRGYWLSPGTFSKSGYALSTPRGYIKGKDYPAKTTYTELTAVIAVKWVAGSSYQTALSLAGQGSGATLKAFALGANANGTAFAGAVMPYGAVSGYPLDSSANYEIIGLRQKSGDAAAYVDNIEWASSSAAVEALSASHFTVGALFNAVGFDFPGKVAGIELFDKCLTDSQMQVVIANVKKRVAAMGEQMVSFSNVLLLEGDSITESLYGNYLSPAIHKKFTPYMKVRGIATGGSDLNTMNTRLPATLRTIQSIVASGRRPIFYVSIGTNGIPTTAALATYWAAIRGAGAKLIVATLIPRDGTNNPTRDAYNAWIRANPSLYDGLADHQANALIGPDAAPLNATYYHPDKVHLTNAGYEVMFGILKPIVDALRLVE